ncbi:hypothetical protein I4U23_025354 [Adineta vaga]|nr:hypothetical protein I4U23_025354 [Adineta vaga]
MQVWTHELDSHLDHIEDRNQLIKTEQQILHEYNEIKADIEENEVAHDLTFTRPFSSYLLPKDPAHYSRERRLYLERLAHVPTVPDLPILSNEFEDELNTCSLSQSDYSPESLPLLLETFYLKRLSSLTYAKTLHTIRWKRFCQQQIDYTQVEQQFHDRSARILAEFNDALERSHRLSSIREALLLPQVAASKITNQAVVNDDYVAYIRFLVCQYRGQKYFDQLTELIRISHLKFRTRFSPDTQAFTINLQPPISPFQTTTAMSRIPSIELDQKQSIERLNLLFRLYSLPLDTSKIRTTGDEMELYANVIRHYRVIFSEQERERVSVLYESARPKMISQARQSSTCKLIKKSTWIPFVTLKAERDPQRERDYWKYIKNSKNDELLMKITQFLHVRNADKGINVLKQYLLALKAKTNTTAKLVLDASTTNSARAVAMSDIFWKNIFDLNSENGTNKEDENSKDNQDNDDLQDSYDFQDSSNRSNHYMKRDEFNYLETLQKLGLDDTSGQNRDNDTENNDASESYGLQLSYLILRLLRIRTLRYRCLNEFNYLRSLQRTITIYEQRLTISTKGKDLQVIDQRFNNYVPHTYLFDTPHECTLDTLEYMQSGEHIDNIEDFSHETTIENDGSIIHVQDPSGIHIIYDCSFDDLNELEQEIISIGSYFLEKASLKSQKTTNDSESIKKMDRFEILYNLWEYEFIYLQLKRQLIDCYYEIYQHTFDQDERHIIAQTILDISVRRPRIDFRTDEYFAHSYSLEIRYLEQYLSLIREYIDRHVNDMRQITENLFDTTDYGAYFPSTRIQTSPPIYLSISKMHSYYLFEFIESLSTLTRLPHILKNSFNELIEFEQLQRQTNLSLTEKLIYELEYLEEIFASYKKLSQPGSMYSPNQQRDIFNTLYSDHPSMMGKLAYEILKQVDEARTTKKEQYEKYLKLNSNLIELVTLRYRLIRSASETELLTTVYKQQLDTMSIDQSHLSLRFIQFEFAQSRNLPNISTDNHHITSQLVDGQLDKITGQQHLLFAIHELEEGTIGRMNFRQKDQWLAYMNDADEAINNFKTVLRLQLMHNHLIYSAILQHRIAIICIAQQLKATKLNTNTEQTKSSSGGKRPTSGKSQIDQPNALLTDVLNETNRRKLFRENYFISIQFEKTPYRNAMLTEFIRQRDSKPMQYQQVREAEKLKRSLLNDFINRIHQRNTLILLRLQIIQAYLSLTHLLQQFPLTSRSHFLWPKPIPVILPTAAITSKSDSNVSSSVIAEELTSNGYKHRPKSLLNENGTELANLWYIPSFLEQLNIFRELKLDLNELQKRLQDILRIISSFNDLIHILVGYAQLNALVANVEQRFSERTNELSTFDQSGEFASELHEIQQEIHSLSSTSLSNVANLLETKRRLTIFQIYFSIGYLIPDCFLKGKNQMAFNNLRSHSLPVLQNFVSDFNRYRPIYSILPEPLLPVQASAKQFYPWTVHEYQYNINAKRLSWPTYALIDLIHLCLIGLKPQELALANTEFISTQVMLKNIEDIVKPKKTNDLATTILRRKEASTDEYLTNYLHLELYIIECIRFELIRYAWCTAKLNVAAINTLKIFDDGFISYRDEVRSPILRQLSITTGHSNFYNDFPVALVNGQLPPHVTEYEYKHALVIRLLIELEGKFMMTDTLKVLKKERTIVLSERLREESSIPTDIWKKQQFTETFSVLRSNILDEFSQMLSEYEYKDEQSTPNSPSTNDNSKDTESTITSSNSFRSTDVYCIRRSDLEVCLKEAGNRLMQRERENYVNYSSYYENVLYNIRQAMIERDNELKSLRSQLQDQQYTMEIDSQLLALSAYFDLLNELIQLRSLNGQLQIDKQLRFDKELIHIRENFQIKIQDLLETNLQLRTEFEKYRAELFLNTIAIIKAIRVETHELARTKLATSAKMIADDLHNKHTKLIEDLHDQHYQDEKIQRERIEETEREYRRHKSELEKTIAQLQYELHQHQKRYVYKTTKQVEEIQALKKANNYLRKRITTNEGQYKKIFETESKTENKANIERISDLRQALNQNQIIETKLRWMQEQSNQLIMKDHELEKKTSEFQRENHAMKVAQAYVKRDLMQTKKKLEQERSLKIDAFHQVETLRTNLNEIEEEFEQVVLNDGTNNLLSPSMMTQNSRTVTSARPVTPYQILLTRNRPMTSNSMYLRDRQRLTNTRSRLQTTSSMKRPQTANVHIEKITPLTEELLTNLGVTTQPPSTSVRMLRIKSAKT